MVNQRWSDLAKLAELAFDAKSQKMAELRAQEAEIVLQRHSLTEMNKSAMTGFVGAHPAHWMSGDFHWQEWVGGNMERLGTQQAQVRARIEMQKPELRKAFGRRSVLSKLRDSQTH